MSASSWLFFISEIKEDIPWLYEAGLELYRALHIGNRPAAKRAEQNIRRLARLAMSSPFSRMAEDKETYFIIRNIEDVIRKLVDKMPEAKRRELDLASQEDQSGEL